MNWHLCNYFHCDLITNEETEWVGVIHSPASETELHVKVTACSQEHLTLAMNDAAQNLAVHLNTRKREDAEEASETVTVAITLETEGGVYLTEGIATLSPGPPADNIDKLNLGHVSAPGGLIVRVRRIGA